MILIERAQRDDKVAFEELIRKYADHLFAYIRVLLPTAQDAEDCFQETFHRAYQKLNTYKHSGSFKAWLFTIGRNLATDFQRKRLKHAGTISLFVQSNDDQDCPISDIEDNSNNPETMILADEKKQLVHQAVQKLPERQREVLILSYFKGLTYPEISEAMNCSVGTIKTQMFRAVRKLAELLPDVAKD